VPPATCLGAFCFCQQHCTALHRRSRQAHPTPHRFYQLPDSTPRLPLLPPLLQDNGNINNFLEVIPLLSDMQAVLQQQRLLDPQGRLLPEEQEELANMLCPWCTHDDPSPEE
jgi:hypothetical protein